MTRPDPWPARPWPAAVPRYATPRNLSRRTLGPQVAEICRRLGYEPMPWQCDCWDVMYELDDNGMLWYREARITVPRQSAKTTSTLVRHTHRALYSVELGWGLRAVTAFTAQHASDARDKMTNEWMPVIEYSEFGESGVVNGEYVQQLIRSNGKEAIKWAGGARTITFPPNATGAHGGTFDLVDIDEAFAFPDNRAEQGARHAMITRKSPQIVIQSTAGTAESAYLKGKVDDGRARVNSGEDGRVYYLEYSVGPDDDIHNPDHWPRWMPALGYTIDIEAVKIEHDTLDPDEFYRAYGNGWTASTSAIIPADVWAAAKTPKSFRSGRVWMAVDAAPGQGGKGRAASVAIASYRDDGSIHSEVLAHGPGLSWVADKIGQLTRQHKVSELFVDPTGPIGQVVPDILNTSMATLTTVDARTMAHACGRYHQALLDGVAKHRGQDMLDAAVAGAAKRVLEDGWAWKRRTSTADISPLVAVTLAHWGAAINGDRPPIALHPG